MIKGEKMSEIRMYNQCCMDFMAKCKDNAYNLAIDNTSYVLYN